MERMAKLLILSACVIALGVACGSDDSDDSNAGAGAGTTGGSAGSSGTSGGSAGSSGTSGGTSGTGGTGGAGSGGTGGTMAAPVVCGGMTCPAPSNSRLTACCVEADDTCGEKIPGGFIMSECAAPVVPDDECESVTAMGFTVPSCCTPEGRCGITAPLIGLPCTANEDLDELANGGDGGMADGGASDGGMSEDGGRGFMNPFAGMAPPPGPCTPD